MMSSAIYFEKPSAAAYEFIRKYQGEELETLCWCDLDDVQKENALKKAAYLITASYPISKALLEKAPNVKLIQKTGSGVDNIDLNFAKERGILVSSTPGVNAASVAELTIAMILSLYRKLNFLDRSTKEGKWLMWEHRSSMYELRGKTHGIVGMGNIGKKVARLSQGFGASVAYYDAYRLAKSEEDEMALRYLPLPELLAAADVVSIHIPLLPSTRNLIGEKELACMKPTAVIVNVSRGNIVDEAALAAALKENRLLGAGLDTFAVEPVVQENPLLTFDNVVATPHIGGGTRDVLAEVLRIAFDNIGKVERGLTPAYVIG